MSKKNTNVENTEKVMTKYDLKMQKRAEEKGKEAKSLLIWKIVGAVIVVGLIGWIASYPIRTAVALNKTLFTLDGKAIKQVEFDYTYNNVKANYMNNYGSYLSYYGLTEDADPSTVMYTQNLTFKDYLEELTVDQLKQNVALEKAMNEAGFTYDATEEYDLFIQTSELLAKTNNMTLGEYLKDTYGKYATKSRLKSVVTKGFEVDKYYSSIEGSMVPDDAQITEYYNNNSATYDSVDYYLTTVNAELPTKPTELADEGATVAEDGSYTPSDAEKEAAMAEAKKEADALEKTVLKDGEFHQGELGSSVASLVKSWLFEDGRKKGDTTVIESTYSNLYYVVGFDSRYLSHAKTADLRVIMTAEDNGEEIISKYNETSKTEDDFISLVSEYSEDTYTSSNGGLYEGEYASNYTDEIREWLFDSSRKEGDVTSFRLQDTYTYVVYFKQFGDEEWKVKVKTTLTSNNLSDYITEIKNAVVFDDPKGNMYFTKGRELDAAAESESTENTTVTAE